MIKIKKLRIFSWLMPVSAFLGAIFFSGVNGISLSNLPAALSNQNAQIVSTNGNDSLLWMLIIIVGTVLGFLLGFLIDKYHGPLYHQQNNHKI